tara:strand:+ start:67 stop:372 length:306 start_codon:yes stop_codon:yes gene_type:complete
MLKIGPVPLKNCPPSEEPFLFWRVYVYVSSPPKDTKLSVDPNKVVDNKSWSTLKLGVSSAPVELQENPIVEADAELASPNETADIRISFLMTIPHKNDQQA